VKTDLEPKLTAHLVGDVARKFRNISKRLGCQRRWLANALMEEALSHMDLDTWTWYANARDRHPSIESFVKDVK
jgi:hypothetical protein